MAAAAAHTVLALPLRTASGGGILRDESAWDLQQIPNTFCSLERWTRIFIAPCLENFRVEIKQAILAGGLAFTQIPRADIIELEGDGCADGILRIRQDKGRGKNSLMSTGDVCLVSHQNLTGCLDLGSREDYGLMLVESRSFRGVEVVSTCKTWGYTASPQRDVFVATIGTTVPIERILQSLVDTKMHESVGEELERAILSGKEIDSPPCWLRNAIDDGITDALERDCARLNESQRSAVRNALIKAGGEGGVSLIQGPPGTGKTSTITAMIRAFLRSRRASKILQCAPTNVAMIEVATRLIAELPEFLCRLDVLIFMSEQRADEHIKTEHLKEFTLSNRIQTAVRSVHSFAAGIFEVLEKRDASNGAISDVFCLNELLKVASVYDANVKQFPAHIMAFGRAIQLHRQINELTVHLSSTIGGHANITPVFEQCRRFYRMTMNDIELDGEGPNMDSQKMRQLCAALANFYIGRARVAFSTINGSMARDAMEFEFDLVIIDEAAQALEAETTCVIRNGLRSLILVGDPKQLPATVFSEHSVQVKFKRSLFERLESLGHPVDLLDVQYRMHPSIAAFSSRQFYQGRIQNGDNTLLYDKAWYDDKTYPPVRFITHTGSLHEVDRTGSSRNCDEAETVCLHLFQFFKAYPHAVTVGIICPYRSQKALLESIVTKISNKPAGAKVDVNTVDGFQGQERDLILLSLTKTQRAGNFLEQLERVNVSLTRARYGLWVFGDAYAFRKRQSSIWFEFYGYCDSLSQSNASPFLQDAAEDTKQFSRAIRRAIADVVRATPAMESAEFRRRVFRKRSFDVWRVVAAKGVLDDVKETPSVRDNFIGVVDNLKRGDFIKAVRCYRKSHGGLASELFYVCRLDGKKVLIWTVEIREGEQVICLLQNMTQSGVSNVWERFKIHISKTPEEYVRACLVDASSRPKRGISVAGGASAAITVGEAAKMFDLSDRGVVEMLTDADRVSRLVLPYLLDENQQQAVRSENPSAIIIGRGGTGKTTVLARKLFEAYKVALTNDVDLPRQLFVSQSKLLVKSLQTEFQSLVQTYHETTGTPMPEVATSAESPLTSRWPQFFSFMDLIVTLDRLLGGLTLFWHSLTREQSAREILLGLSHGGGTRIAKITLDNVITIERFAAVYYFFASDRLRNMFSANFLFTEFMNTIKRVSDSGEKVVMSMESYISLGGADGVLTKKNREAIYSFYKRFEAEKLSRGDVDICDVMASIISRMHGKKLIPVDRIYLDEVQDLMQSQYIPFKMLRDDNTLFVCSGDQAQAITAGHKFRFSTLKEYLFRLTGSAPSETFLSRSYRSSESVLRLSNAILDVLGFFFTDEIDRLPPESNARGTVGERPCVLLEKNISETLGYLFDDSKDFSAEQVFLVRTTKDKKALLKMLEDRGCRATVLTILESKGLEYDDVIMYKVLSETESRVLLRYKPKEGVSVPDFDTKKHGDLCQALKELYVAVTRSKKRLIMVDDDVNDVFMHLFGEFVAPTTIADAAPFGKSKSSAAEWENRAEQYVAAGLWSDALNAYLMAHNFTAAKRVEARILQIECDRHFDVRHLIKAAYLYKEIGDIRDSAEMFCKAKMFKEAGEAYCKLGDAGNAIKCCRDGKEYDLMARYVEKFKDILGDDICDMQYVFLAEAYFGISESKAMEHLRKVKSDGNFLGVIEKRLQDRHGLIFCYKERNAIDRGVKFVQMLKAGALKTKLFINLLWGETGAHSHSLKIACDSLLADARNKCFRNNHFEHRADSENRIKCEINKMVEKIIADSVRICSEIVPERAHDFQASFNHFCSGKAHRGVFTGRFINHIFQVVIECVFIVLNATAKLNNDRKAEWDQEMARYQGELRKYEEARRRYGTAQRPNGTRPAPPAEVRHGDFSEPGPILNRAAKVVAHEIEAKTPLGHLLIRKQRLIKSLQKAARFGSSKGHSRRYRLLQSLADGTGRPFEEIAHRWYKDIWSDLITKMILKRQRNELWAMDLRFQGDFARWRKAIEAVHEEIRDRPKRVHIFPDVAGQRCSMIELKYYK